MRRLVLLLLPLLMLFAPNPATAQTDVPRVYMMYFQVDLEDLPKWIENYEQHERPLLDSLEAEGALMNHDFWLHNTGGEYNVRYNFVVRSWGAIEDFLNAYYPRVDPGIAEEWSSMIVQHTDEIWRIGDTNIPDGGSDSPIIYESSSLVDYGEMEQYVAGFETYGKPALDRAVEEGLLQGWAELRHDTGGPWNVRMIYWLDSWDAADDALMRVGEIRQELGEDWEGGPMIRSHADNVWQSVPRSGN